MNQYALMNSGYGVKKNIRLGFSIPAIGLSKGAKQKLRWMDYYQEQHNAAKTCRYFGISRKTFHKWLKRYSPKDLYTLEEKSRRPERYRVSKKQREYGAAITALRAERPTWSKYKIGAFIRHGGAVRPHGSLKFLTPDKFLESVKI